MPCTSSLHATYSTQYHLVIIIQNVTVKSYWTQYKFVKIIMQYGRRGLSSTVWNCRQLYDFIISIEWKIIIFFLFFRFITSNLRWNKFTNQCVVYTLVLVELTSFNQMVNDHVTQKFYSLDCFKSVEYIFVWDLSSVLYEVVSSLHSCNFFVGSYSIHRTLIGY